MAPGKLAGEIAGMSGTRNLSDNLSDLKAQARITGPQLLGSMTGMELLLCCLVLTVI